MGDLNLKDSRRLDINYLYRELCTDFDRALGDLYLTQLNYLVQIHKAIIQCLRLLIWDNQTRDYTETDGELSIYVTDKTKLGML